MCCLKHTYRKGLEGSSLASFILSDNFTLQKALGAVVGGLAETSVHVIVRAEVLCPLLAKGPLLLPVLSHCPFLIPKT